MASWVESFLSDYRERDLKHVNVLINHDKAHPCPSRSVYFRHFEWSWFDFYF